MYQFLKKIQGNYEIDRFGVGSSKITLNKFKKTVKI